MMNEPKVTDKRRVQVDVSDDPLTTFLQKVLHYAAAQPEWPILMSLPRPVRKQVARDFAAVVTRMPDIRKLRNDA